MANEFTARNGIIAKNNSIISGSLTNGGTGVVANGLYSHAEGVSTQAIGEASHVEGVGTTTNGDYSHAEGSNNTAHGIASHAEGDNTQAYGNYSHAEGIGTTTDADYQHVQGRYNLASLEDSAFILGNGVDDSNKSNLILAYGTQVQITGSLDVSGSITGSLIGTASWATEAINATTATTASFAVSASFATNASQAQTASFVNTLNQTVTITGSLNTSGSIRTIGTGSINLTGSINVTGSLIAAGDSNVGIGTATPAVKLHVSGAGSEAVRINGTGTTGIVIQAGSLTGGPGRIELNAGTNNNSNVRVGSTYLRESSGFLIVANALVGAPTATLQARGSGATAATKNFLIQNSTPVDILTIFDNKAVNISGSVTVTGSLLILPSSSFTLPTTQSVSPAAGTAYFSNNFLYVYNGSAWKSASLS
jgi:hypothetical protein